MKKKIIWSNIDLNVDDWKDAYKEYLKADELDGDPEDENALYEWVVDTNNLYLEDEYDNLNIPTEGRILMIADLGLWNGRSQGYKVLGRNANNIFSMHYDYTEWYFDGHNVRAIDHHHDGTNTYLYRIIREDKNIDNLLDDICSGKKISRQKLNYYTKSMRSCVQEAYGW